MLQGTASITNNLASAKKPNRLPAPLRRIYKQLCSSSADPTVVAKVNEVSRSAYLPFPECPFLQSLKALHHSRGEATQFDLLDC